MHIEHTFKVNAFSAEKGVISVSYTAVDATLELPVHHIPQLGVEKQDIIDYSTGVIDDAEFKIRIRRAVVLASAEPIYAWNERLAAKKLVVPAEVDGMLGFEWPLVTEAEVLGSNVEVL